MKISIIVPVYNTEKYLKRCIDSILSQNYADFELLLVGKHGRENHRGQSYTALLRASRLPVGYD